METAVLEVKLQELQTELKAKWNELEGATGTRFKELKQKITELQDQVDGIDTKMAERQTAYSAGKSFNSLLEENDGVMRLLREKQGTAVIEIPEPFLERKTTIDSAAVGVSTSGVLTIDRTPGIVTEARQRLFLRNALTARPTSLQLIDFVKVNSALSRASMQTESSAKVENATTFNTASARVQTIASWIPASRQVLDDMNELGGFLQGGLSYYVNLTEEVQFLTGSNTGNDLNGLVTQGTAYNTALNSLTPGWKKGDIIARAIQQILIAKEIDPTFVVLHPTDYWDIRLTKDSQGRYLDPTGLFWGLTPIITTAIGSGNFLVGSGNPAAVEIRDRMGLTVEISTQHQDYFVKNLVAIRAEKRVALVCYRPGSFIQGTFTTSP